MTFFHCPKKFRGKPYGCGYGPITKWAAFWDFLNTYPRCGKKLKRVRNPAKQKMAAIQEHLDAAATAAELFGPKAGTTYVATHRPRK